MKNNYRALINIYKQELLHGKVLAIDPGSISPGFAWFENGELTSCGVYKLSKTASIYERLQTLSFEMYKERADVLIIEQIRGSMAHEYLKWAVGVSIAAAQTPKVIELPIFEWKKFSKTKASYFKSDTQDAIIIGETVIHLAGA